jgi:hypothetical protein
MKGNLPLKNNTMRTILAAIVVLIAITPSFTQNSAPFTVSLEPMIPEGFTGLQSYVWAKSGNKILLIGGRTDGLHRRQPFASFNKKYNNTDLIVLDVKTEKVWKKPVTGLPAALAAQLQSSNTEFYQQQNDLIIIGGYGYSETKRDHITHPSILKIKVKEMIDRIINNKDITPSITQLTDERMAVTGGRLNKLDNIFYLVGGQRFDGRYNPHGPDHGPGFLQEYTNQIRKFSITEKDGKIILENYIAITDTALLHRRDYNLLNQYDENGREMLTIYSGVFQYDKDLPYTTLVDITPNNHHEVENFNQQFCHYHSATLPVYNKSKKTLYTIFFGGIAQNYVDEYGVVKTDNDVPFVKHISVVERNASGIKEYLLPGHLSGYFGAAAEFIPADETLFSNNGILQLDKTGTKALLAGYIIGGIDSRAPNVFWSNEAEPSRASPVIWKVYLSKK